MTGLRRALLSGGIDAPMVQGNERLRRTASTSRQHLKAVARNFVATRLTAILIFRSKRFAMLFFTLGGVTSGASRSVVGRREC